MMSVIDMPFDAAYITVAWLSWIPNLMVAEWIVYRVKSD